MKKITAAALILFICTALSAEIETIQSGFPEPFNPNGSAEISKDSSKLLVKTSHSGWNTAYSTKPGIFKPQTDYVIYFDAKRLDDSEKSFLHCLVRKSGSIHPDNDLLQKNIYPAKKKKTYILKFSTPAICDSYAFQIHTLTPSSFEIDNFRICVGSADKFIPLGSDVESGAATPPVPTGAKEFEVLPPEDPDRLVVNAADFGASEDCPDLPKALNAAIAHCKKVNASKLVLNKGRYKITSSRTIHFIGLQNFVFDASGSTFIYNKRSGANVRISDCQRVEIKNLNIDWDWKNDPLASLGKVVGEDKGAPECSFDVEFFTYDNHPLYGKPIRFAMLTPYDHKKKRLGFEGCCGLISVDQTTPKEKYCKTEWLTPNTVRIYDNKGGMRAKMKKGDYFRIQHYYYDMTCFYVRDNTHLTLRNINIFSCAGHAVLCDGKQSYWQMVNFNIATKKPVEKRPITTTADHIHFARSQGFFKMIGCEISRGADDCVNFHDCSAVVKKIGPRKLRSIQRRNIDMFAEGNTVELLQFDYERTGIKIKSSSVKKLEDGNWEIETESDLPEQTGDCFVAFSPQYDTRNIILRDCYFHDGSSNGLLLLARDITIEDCILRNNLLCAIKFLTGYTYKSWCEGYGVDNVVIRNCLLDRPNPTNKSNNGKVADIFAAMYMRVDPSEEQSMRAPIRNVLIENNRFVGTKGLIAYIASADNFIMRGNTFEIKSKPLPDLKYRGGFFVTHSSNVDISGNKYITDLPLEGAGVYYTPETVSNLTFSNNSVEREAKE